MKKNISLSLLLFVVLLAVGVVMSSPISKSGFIPRQVGVSKDIQVLSLYGSSVCQVSGILYAAGEDLPTDDPCEYCTCQPPGFACQVVKCDYKPGCRALQRSGFCCPEYVCDCEFNGNIYKNGDRISDNENPCEDCYCVTGEITCSLILCSKPPLENCVEQLEDGQCCPTFSCTGDPEYTIEDVSTVTPVEVDVEVVDAQREETVLEEIATTEMPDEERNAVEEPITATVSEIREATNDEEPLEIATTSSITYNDEGTIETQTQLIDSDDRTDADLIKYQVNEEDPITENSVFNTNNEELLISETKIDDFVTERSDDTKIDGFVIERSENTKIDDFVTERSDDTLIDGFVIVRSENTKIDEFVTERSDYTKIDDFVTERSEDTTEDQAELKQLYTTESSIYKINANTNSNLHKLTVVPDNKIAAEQIENENVITTDIPADTDTKIVQNKKEFEENATNIDEVSTVSIINEEKSEEAYWMSLLRSDLTNNDKESIQNKDDAITEIAIKEDVTEHSSEIRGEALDTTQISNLKLNIDTTTDTGLFKMEDIETVTDSEVILGEERESLTTESFIREDEIEMTNPTVAESDIVEKMFKSDVDELKDLLMKDDEENENVLMLNNKASTNYEISTELPESMFNDATEETSGSIRDDSEPTEMTEGATTQIPEDIRKDDNSDYWITMNQQIPQKQTDKNTEGEISTTEGTNVVEAKIVTKNADISEDTTISNFRDEVFEASILSVEENPTTEEIVEDERAAEMTTVSNNIERESSANGFEAETATAVEGMVKTNDISLNENEETFLNVETSTDLIDEKILKIEETGTQSTNVHEDDQLTMTKESKISDTKTTTEVDSITKTNETVSEEIQEKHETETTDEMNEAVTKLETENKLKIKEPSTRGGNYLLKRKNALNKLRKTGSAYENLGLRPLPRRSSRFKNKRKPRNQNRYPRVIEQRFRIRIPNAKQRVERVSRKQRKLRYDTGIEGQQEAPIEQN